MAEAIFKALDLHKHFRGLRAADGVTVEVGRGEFRAIIGPNGAAKSTFFNLVPVFISPDRGSVVFDGHDVTAVRPYRLFRHGTSRTFHIASILADLTVRENLEIARLSHHRRLFDVFRPAPG